MINRRNLLGLSLATAGFAVLATTAGPAFAKSPLALTGYDPVSYFSGNRPSRGKSQFTAQYRGLTYQFSSARNRDAFVANPARYAPQFDGYCAYGVSRGYKVGVDPLAYKVVSGKLYVNYSKSVQRTWSRDIPGYIAKANRNWPGLK
ncbi:YHS domain-containing (seleno)protein [Labrenzia sp. VG12]|uniref:YHS domain-containing (seleno)protein n=1 Tax=Labrenzia sp. VG12 TaxID=2021862 RepID=UPI000B8C4F48|nr:YHS domain-containing (seleno)protein [Labrenzia sp. VG12]ASP35695.1 tat pathway signal sequence domain protein [Labrenzia sp. VG12]